MRTSKKAGRGSSWGIRQSDGQAVAPALSPAVSRYRSDSSRRSVTSQLVRGFGWFLLLVLVIGAGIGGGLYLYANESLNAVKGHTKQITAAEILLHHLGSPSDPAVALVAGYDHRAGMGTSSYAGSNSDTLMLIRADPKKGTLSLLSFPRDLNVPIYCKGNTITTYDRVNAAWADCGKNGGPRAALDTIEHLTGLKVIPDFLITLDFHAFQQTVDRLGGVYLNVDRRYYNKNIGTYDTNYADIDLHPGYQRLNGAQALSYVRFRHLDSDIYRNGRQQLFMEALKARIKSTLSLTNIDSVLGIIGALKGNLEVAKADGSAPTLAEMKSYLGLLISLPPGHLIRNSIPAQDLQNYVTAGGADELKASPQAIAGAVQRFLHPHVPAVQTHKPGGGTKAPKLPHKDISVLVLNAGNINGEAAHTSSLLHRQGFDTKPAANAPSHARDTVVYYDPSQATGQQAAKELAPLFGSHTNVAPMTQAIASFAHKAGNPLTVVAVGTAYKGRLQLPHAGGSRGGSTANAQVQPGVRITLSAIRSMNGPAHFPLLLPHTVAKGSSLTTLAESVRIFKPVRGKQEVVLTFFGPGSFDYWQIEESNWTTEPLFATKPTVEFVYRGRTYSEYTSGGAIQTIAVRYQNNVYWVQNTILNSLSNATMIAIAEGLQPLR